MEYETDNQGGPILPMFTTTKPSRKLIDEIRKHLVPGEAGISNLPVFCDYNTKSSAPVADGKPVVPREVAPGEEESDEAGSASPIRGPVWKSVFGSQGVGGQYIAVPMTFRFFQ